MNALHAVLREPLFEQLGWMLVHSVWQCAAVALALAVVLRMLRRSESRYLAGCAALLGCVGLMALTFVLMQPAPEPPALPMIREPVAPTLSLTSTPESIPVDIHQPPTPSKPFPLSLAAVLWLAGVVMLCARHVMGWMSLRRLRRGSQRVTDRPTLARLHAIMQRLGITRTVELAESARVQVPSMIGHLRPLILLPVGAIANLSPMHLDAILAHELAHIRRHDYLANLLQTLIETLLFYHPAVWWISKSIRQEREHCCDDMAVRLIGSAREYGAALAAMEELRLPAAMAMAAGGGSLLKRIQRLVKPEPRRASIVWPLVLCVGVIVLIGACTQTKKEQAQAEASGVHDECASHLRLLAVSVANFAQRNAGRYPDDLGNLIATQSGDRWVGPRYIPTLKYVVCPVTGHKVPDTISQGTPAEQAIWARTGSDYIYVGKGLLTQRETTARYTPIVVAYEGREHHGTGKGVHVVFGDARVERLSMDAARKAIARSDEYRAELQAQAQGRQTVEQPATTNERIPSTTGVLFEIDAVPQSPPASGLNEFDASSSPFAGLVDGVRLEPTPQERVRKPNAEQPFIFGYSASPVQNGAAKQGGALLFQSTAPGNRGDSEMTTWNGGTIQLVVDSSTQLPGQLLLLGSRLTTAKLTTLTLRNTYAVGHPLLDRAEQTQEGLQKLYDQATDAATPDVLYALADQELRLVLNRHTELQMERIEAETKLPRDHPTLQRMRATEEDLAHYSQEKMRQLRRLTVQARQASTSQPK